MDMARCGRPKSPGMSGCIRGGSPGSGVLRGDVSQDGLPETQSRKCLVIAPTLSYLNIKKSDLQVYHHEPGHFMYCPSAAFLESAEEQLGSLGRYPM